MTTTPEGAVKLEILHAKPEDCGAYKLVITNPNGQSVALCAVAVKRKPFVQNKHVVPTLYLIINLTCYLLRQLNR